MSFLGLLLLLAALAWLLIKSSQNHEALQRLERRVITLETRLAQRRETESRRAPAVAETAGLDPALATPSFPTVAPEENRATPALAALPAMPEVSAMVSPVEPASVPPPLPATRIFPEPTAAAASVGPPAATLPGPIRVSPSSPPVRRGTRVAPPVQWESFLGIKLFAWLGGLALFLGVAFFVKYSFDHNLISPAWRVGIGYAVGAGLLIGAAFLSRERLAVTVQSLTATGIVVLYADTFAAQARYDLLGLWAAFGIMAAITVLAFERAIRLNAQVVAVLGWLGGFLTPWLLSTGQDNPAGLFGYLALLDLGLLAVAVRQRWNVLAGLAAVATVVMQFGWVASFFTEAKVLIAMAVFVGFAGLFLGGFWLAHRRDRVDRWTVVSAVVPAVGGWLFAAYVLWRPYAEIAGRVGLLLGFVLILDLVFVALAFWRPRLRPLLLAAGAVVFLLLMHWTARFLTPPRLNVALVFYLLFAGAHAVVPFWLEHRRPSERGSASLLRWMHAFPSLGLLLVLFPLFTFGEIGFFLWPVVLALDLIAIGLAVVTAELTSLLAVVMLTALGAAAWIFQRPVQTSELNGMLMLVGAFAIFFVGATLLAGRRLYGAARGGAGHVGTTPTPALTREQFGQAASLSAVLPFLLLAMAVVRLPVPNPSLVFVLAGALAAGLLWVAARGGFDALMVVTAGSVLMLEYVWFFDNFQPASEWLAVGWTAGFAALIFAIPLQWFRGLAQRRLPWAVSGLAWPLHFPLFYEAFGRSHPSAAYPGLIPLVLALPCAAGLWLVVKLESAEAPGALARRAWYGGAALFFITLTIPIQFERHWITVAWALEGAALLAWFRRVPHPGLRLTGAGLLMAAFIRLALNPWVILAYDRTGTPFFNWYLYTYGVAAGCLLIGARLLAPPRNMALGTSLPPWLCSMGTILLFLLLNIEIADYFSPPGGRLVFNFSAGFAQDMAYTLGWALFGSALMAVGFAGRSAGTRYAGLGLLIVTMVKLFLHDLWQLGGLYRIGALVGLAVVLILISFVYQRFLGGANEADEKQA